MAEAWHVVKARLRVLPRVNHAVQLFCFVSTFVAQHFVGIIVQVREADTLTLVDRIAHALRMILQLVMTNTLVVDQVAFVLMIILGELRRLL